MATSKLFTVHDGTTVANYKAWASTISSGISGLGWVAQTGHGEVTWANVTVTPNPTATTTPRALYNFRGPIANSTAYVGGTADNGTYDVVTDAGCTYVCILSFTSGAPYTAPLTDTTHWVPLNFEIWKSNGSMSATSPLYLKILYTIATNASQYPSLHISIGTGVDSNGNLTGAMTCFSSAPFTIARVNAMSSNNGAINTFEMDFSGDADNLRMCLWRNGYAVGSWSTGTGVPPIIVIDRAKTSAGADSDGYTYVGLNCVSLQNATSVTYSAVLLKPTLGSQAQANTPAGSSYWIGCPVFPNGVTSAMGAATPAAVFPMVGFLSNPMMGAVVFDRTVVTEGSVLPIYINGGWHYFMVCGQPYTSATYTQITGVSSSTCVAIRWE